MGYIRLGQGGHSVSKVLVVEDNELNLKLFCDLLRAHGYAAEPVRDEAQHIVACLSPIADRFTVTVDVKDNP